MEQQQNPTTTITPSTLPKTPPTPPAPPTPMTTEPEPSMPQQSLMPPQPPTPTPTTAPPAPSPPASAPAPTPPAISPPSARPGATPAPPAAREDRWTAAPKAPRAQETRATEASSPTSSARADARSTGSTGVRARGSRVRSRLPSVLGIGTKVPVPLDQSKPSINVRVHHNELEGRKGNGLNKANFWRGRRHLQGYKVVSVEATPDNVAESVFYAPESDLLAATEYVRVEADPHSDALVRQDDHFEIEVLGVSVSPYDFSSTNNNEVLVYSLKKEAATHDGDIMDGSEMSASLAPTVEARSARPTKPSEFTLAEDDILYVHYDPVSDGHSDGSEPDVFLKVPASKAMYMSSNGAVQAGKKRREDSVNMRFKVLEIDQISNLQADAVHGLDQARDLAGRAAVPLPYLQVLTGAFSAASALGKRGLRKYAKPDHVLTTDFRFLLAEPKGETTSGARTAGGSGERGDYLRYGYYFFLNKNVDSKLYAQTGASVPNVPLKLRRTDALDVQETRFFPLTGVSYLAVRVRRARHAAPPQVVRTAVNDACAQRVINLCRMSEAVEVLSKLERSKAPPAWAKPFAGRKQRLG